MPAMIFGHSADVPAALDERSIYTFALGGAPQGGFESNVVIVREPANGRDLVTYVGEQRRKLGAELPGATFVRDGKAKAGALPAHEHQYRLTPGRPLPMLIQHHTAIARDGFFYDFCVTAPSAEIEKHRKTVASMIESWAKG